MLVTGAGSGIGRAVCHRLAEAGANVVLSGRNEGKLRETLVGCSGDGHRILVADMLKPESFGVTDLPALEGFVHAAGVCEPRPARSADAAFVANLIGTNLESPLNLLSGLLRANRLVSGASVVLIGSIAARCGAAGLSVYAASKGGLSAATRALAIELAPKRIRVNVVEPGSVRTPLLDRLTEAMTEESIAALERAHPLGIGEPDDVAYAVNYLLSPAARRVTGTTLVVDGGYSAD